MKRRFVQSYRSGPGVWRGSFVVGAAITIGCSSSSGPLENGGSPEQAGSDGGSSTGSGADGASSGTGSSGSGAALDSGTGTDSGATASEAGTSTAGNADSASGGTPSTGTVLAGDAGPCGMPAGIDANTATALQIVNNTRAAMGSPCATMVAALNTSATTHCQYFAANLNSSTANCNSKPDPHSETSGCPDFVGADPGTREKSAGYTSNGWAEVMAFDDNSTKALGQWINSIWHRTPVLSPWTRDLGYGAATGCDTIDFGTGAASPGNLVMTYPYDGQTGVMTSFNGTSESPAPPPPPAGWPSGYPVHVYLQGSTITLTTDEMSVDGGASILHQVITPQTSNGVLGDAVVVYANSPLTSGTRYRVHVAGTRQGRTSSASFDVNIAFTTK